MQICMSHNLQIYRSETFVTLKTENMPLQTSCHSASAVCLLLLLHIGVTAPSIAHNLRKWGVVSFTHVSFQTAQLLWSTKPQKIAFLLQNTVNSTWAMPLHCLGDITCYIRTLTLSDKKESHFPGKTDIGTKNNCQNALF